MLQLPGGARLDSDDELVHRPVEDGRSGGDGLYVAAIAEATELPEARVREVVAGLADQQVLTGACRGRRPRTALGDRHRRLTGAAPRPTRACPPVRSSGR